MTSRGLANDLPAKIPLRSSPMAYIEKPGTSFAVTSQDKTPEFSLWFNDFCFAENTRGRMPNTVHPFDK